MFVAVKIGLIGFHFVHIRSNNETASTKRFSMSLIAMVRNKEGRYRIIPLTSWWPSCARRHSPPP